MDCIKLGVLAIVAALVFGGCGGSSDKGSDGGDSVGFRVLHQGDYPESGVYGDGRYTTFHTQAEYEATLLSYSSEDAAEVDFDQHQVALLDMGVQPSTAYAIELVSVTGGDGDRVAHVTLTKPSEDCTAETVLTNPYQFVEVRSAQPIASWEETVVFDCPAVD